MFPTALLTLVLLAGEAQEKQVSPPTPTGAAAPAEIATFIEQLDAPRFSQRQAAVEKLFAIGKPAIPGLLKAAQGESLEATIRSIEVLRRLLEGPQPDVTQAAQEALQQIAESQRPAAAGRAKEILRQRELAAAARRNANVPNMFGGNVQIMAGAGILGRQVRVSHNNGVKETEITENDRKIKIREDKDSIRVERTQKRNGKDVTSFWQAKNADELKKNHPEAHKLYEESKNQPPIVIQIAGGQVAVPLPAVPAMHQMNILNMYLDNARRQMESLEKGGNLDQLPEELRQRFKKSAAGLKEQMAALEKRLAEPAKNQKPAVEKSTPEKK